MFKILEKSKISEARIGEIKTKHGSIKTPVFLPDATRGYIKLLGNSDLEQLNIGPMVVNTLHLYLQPNMEIIKKAGGIHDFMGYDSPLLSDSGGFQVYSLIHENPKMGKITDEKVIFKSPLDGSSHEFTPEKSISLQFDLGTDMIVCLDDCPPNDFDEVKIKAAVNRTVEWAKACKQEYDRQVKKRGLKGNEKPLIFSVIQGGQFKELRKECARELKAIGFDGYGFGARPVDKAGNFLKNILFFTAEQIPSESIRFALGVGLPEDIVRCASYGWDMFDCVIPTREGRHGRLFFSNDHKISFSQKRKLYLHKNQHYNIINITNSRFSRDLSPINRFSRLKELRQYNKAYLNHLFKTKDPLGQRIASLNNLEFYLDLMEKIRDNIIKNTI